MTSLSLRTTAIAAMLSGASLVVGERLLLVVADEDHCDCNSGSDLWVNALYLLAFLLIAPAVLGLSRRQSSRAGKFGSVSAAIAATARQ